MLPFGSDTFHSFLKLISKTWDLGGGGVTCKPSSARKVEPGVVVSSSDGTALAYSRCSVHGTDVLMTCPIFSESDYILFHFSLSSKT